MSYDARILAKSSTLLPAITRLIVAEFPTWHPRHGLCPNCAQRTMLSLAASRHTESLHTQQDSPTTFPYYHPDEEVVLSQPERLPAYTTFGGRNVTIAFLDSGYYPHPDLLRESTWTGLVPQWERLSGTDLQGLLAAQDLRIVDYVDLTDGSERIGLEQPSLWDGAGDSWHGQMTTTIATGNGLLSEGHYRGYAPRANVLPIKIGRSDGRIPEEDILRGLSWLLRDDNWARYNVRVLNISVGGDFAEPWDKNPVALAAEALAERGVLIAAAAGNSGQEELRAPASAPSILTVGGIDDGNRPWQRQEVVRNVSLYPHNYGTVIGRRRKAEQISLQKPELLALGCWLPAPILPVSVIFREMVTIGKVRRLLLGYDPLENDEWPNFVEFDHNEDVARYRPPQWMPEVWQGLRQRMNAHKWIHPYYQHVDGTSVSVAQVSAVAAQMVEANPHLKATQIKQILLQSALSIVDHPPHLTGAGLLHPRVAVAMALRYAGGPLVGKPMSATLISTSALAAMSVPQWMEQDSIPLLPHENFLQDKSRAALATPQESRTVYFGLYAPHAHAVSIIGPFNHWQPGQHPLAKMASGWWHCAFVLPFGRHLYRFWVEDQSSPVGTWLPDVENPSTVESGYPDHHSMIEIL